MRACVHASVRACTLACVRRQRHADGRPPWKPLGATTCPYKPSNGIAGAAQALSGCMCAQACTHLQRLQQRLCRRLHRCIRYRGPLQALTVRGLVHRPPGAGTATSSRGSWRGPERGRGLGWPCPPLHPTGLCVWVERARYLCVSLMCIYLLCFASLRSAERLAVHVAGLWASACSFRPLLSGPQPFYSLASLLAFANRTLMITRGLIRPVHVPRAQH